MCFIIEYETGAALHESQVCPGRHTARALAVVAVPGVRELFAHSQPGAAALVSR